MKQNTSVNWKVLKPDVSRAFLSDLAEKLEVSPLICSLLYQRGITTFEDMSLFLNPGLRYLPLLESWPELLDGASLIASEAAAGKKIVVWGDYDADGVTSAALLQDFFARKGIATRSYLPHRIREGYGLNPDGIETLAREGVRTLITVDCGISDHQEILRAKELGMSVVVTDHHLPGRDMPPADVIINPKCGHTPCPALSGVGTAFYLAAALNSLLPGPSVDVREFLDLVALGTIADLVPLDGPNRILVKNGLLLLSEGRRPGIYALKEKAGFGGADHIGSEEVGYGLGPRINAAGRLDSPETALELLLCQDRSKAAGLADKLNRLNEKRRKTENEILIQAREQAAQFINDPGLVLFDPEWHSGVLGIVASRMVDEFSRPCFVLTRENGVIRGSGRSAGNFDLYLGLSSMSNLLLGFGGHSQAAGVSMHPDGIDGFRNGFSRAILDQLGPDTSAEELILDACPGFDQLTPDFLQELELLQPFGPLNPKPVFLSPPLKVLDQTLFGKARHVGFMLSDPVSGLRLRGQFWRQGETWGRTGLKGRTIILAYTPGINTYRNLTSIRLNIREILRID